MIKIFIALLATFLTTVAGADVGASPYFLSHPKFDIDAYRQRVRGLGPYPVAFLWNTPGHDLDKVRHEIRRPKVTFIEMVLINETCVRNRNCGSYELFHGLTVKQLKRYIANENPRLKKKVLAYSEKAAKWLFSALPPEKECLINPLLETQTSRREGRIFFSWIAPIFKPRCSFVWNPLGDNPGKPIPYAEYSEGHGRVITFKDNNCIANNDGVFLTHRESRIFTKVYSACKAVFLWTHADNCREDKETAFIDPRLRGCGGSK